MKDYLIALEEIIEEQRQRIKRMEESSPLDLTSVPTIIVGIIPGDGIGPFIMDHTKKVLAHLLKEEILEGKIEFRNIEGLTIENRAKEGKGLPPSCLNEIKECHVLLKGPTETPNATANVVNIESANVALRRELDLFANVRPVTIPQKNIDWIFFRENTEGEYVLGSKGIELEGMALDFKVTTDRGTERICEAAFKYAKAKGNLKVSIVTKANIMKKTDGKFLKTCYEVAQRYPSVPVDDWYVDIMAANLLNPNRQWEYQVILTPNLYGDILTDEAAQLQGGVGTAGSGNIGDRYAMFEAIHGSAPRMVKMGRGKYANPSSLLKAAEMMLNHIGMTDKADKLKAALDETAKAMKMTGKGDGNTGEDYVTMVLSKI